MLEVEGSSGAVDGDSVGHADRAYKTLLRAIATCEILPGAVLNERLEAAKLQMSRTPFREALHRLEADGLVNARPHTRVRVSLLDPDTIEGHFVVREVLETELVRTVIAERRPVDLSRLQVLLGAMREAVAKREVKTYLRSDEDFHLTICRAAGNQPALDAIQRAWTHVNRLRYMEPGDPANLRGSLAEHRSLLKSLRQKDEGSAETTVRLHIDRARGLLRDLMRELPGVFVTSR